VVTRKFSALTFRQQKFDYTRDELLTTFLPQVKSALPGIPFNASGLVRDLVEAVPLLTMEGDTYRWAHRSLQEYFVASHICHDATGDRAKVLAEMARSERVNNYVQVLDLCSELAPNEWRQCVLREILQTWVDHRSNVTNHLKAQGIPQEQIDARASMTCMMNFGVCSVDSIPAGVTFEIPTKTISRWHAASLEVVEKNAGESRRNSVRFGFTLSAPCAVPIAKSGQTYAISSQKLESMHLVSYRRPIASIDYQRLQSVLGGEPEVTNDFSTPLAINSAQNFEGFNQLMEQNCKRFVSWPRVDQLLEELNRERIQIEQANNSQAAW